jgi:hypothetical protein
MAAPNETKIMLAAEVDHERFHLFEDRQSARSPQRRLIAVFLVFVQEQIADCASEQEQQRDQERHANHQHALVARGFLVGCHRSCLALCHGYDLDVDGAVQTANYSSRFSRIVLINFSSATLTQCRDERMSWHLIAPLCPVS